MTTETAPAAVDDLPRRLYLTRHAARMTQAQLARRLGVARMTVVRWERRQLAVHPLRVAGILAALDQLDREIATGAYVLESPETA